MKLKKEAKELIQKDKVLAKIITKELLTTDPRGSVYESLLRSIISQQISVSAANSIREKFLKLFKNEFPEPNILLKTDDERLRSAGLSLPKVAYMKNVAKHFEVRNYHENKFQLMSDQEIIDDLVKIKGVGEWTAQMILMFTLNRSDVFAYKDLALVSPIIHLYKIKKDKYTPKKLREKILKITQKWSPHRTLASRYLWEFNGEYKKQIKEKTTLKRKR